ncbi:MAG: hypothetical protein CK532_02335 [Flavobacteriales bacterium]|nr:MAG: hypothetical protein CK532_02335 [Flavobacteriales bacterium]
MKTGKILFTISAIIVILFTNSCEHFHVITVNYDVSQTIQNDKTDTIHAKTLIVTSKDQYNSTIPVIDSQSYDYTLASGEKRTFHHPNSQLYSDRLDTIFYYFDITDAQGKMESFMRTIATKEFYLDTKISETIVIKD